MQLPQEVRGVVHRHDHRGFGVHRLVGAVGLHQLPRDRGNPRDLAVDRLHEPRVRMVGGDGAAHQQEGVLDPGQRVVHLVGHPRGQRPHRRHRADLAPSPLGFMPARLVAPLQQHALHGARRIAQRRGNELDPPRGLIKQGDHRLQAGALTGHRLRHQPTHPVTRIPQHVPEGEQRRAHPHEGLGRLPHRRRHGRIGRADAASPIHQHHQVRGLVKGLFEDR